MKILSSFKDYYDFVSTQYGVDDRIVYNRNKIENTPIKVPLTYKPISTSGLDLFYRPTHDTDFDYRWLVVTGKSYLVIQRQAFVPNFPRVWELYSEYKHKDLVDKLKSKLIYRPRTIDSLMGFEDPFYVALHKTLKMPVFMVTRAVFSRERFLLIDNAVPHLGNLGFASLVEPTKVFQNISHYLTDIISQTPDTLPLVTVSDIDLIVGKGFDLKQSFRHRSPN